MSRSQSHPMRRRTGDRSCADYVGNMISKKTATHMDTPPVPKTRTKSPALTGIGPRSALYAVTAADLLNIILRGILLLLL